MGLENGEWGLGGSGVETREKSVRSQKPEAGTGDWGMGGSCYCHALDLWTVPRLQDAVT